MNANARRARSIFLKAVEERRPVVFMAEQQEPVLRRIALMVLMAS